MNTTVMSLAFAIPALLVTLLLRRILWNRQGELNITNWQAIVIFLAGLAAGFGGVWFYANVLFR